MTSYIRLIVTAVFSIWLMGCGSSSGGQSSSGQNDNDDPAPNNPSSADDDIANYIPKICQDSNGETLTGKIPGETNRQQILMSDSGKNISFEIYNPTEIDCDNIAAGAHPLVLHGHGFGGSRSTGANDFQSLRDAGYAVISIDQRGFGDSTGTITVMNPNFEGQDLVTILDYAEQELDYLAWRDEASKEFISRPEPAESLANGVNLVVGTTGGSYGGGYQLLLHNMDDKQRIDAMVPDITWHDLRYSLNQDDAVKSVWDILLVSLGEAGAFSPAINPDRLLDPNATPPTNTTDRGLEPFVRETLTKGLIDNTFPRDSLEYFNYHSPSYWCNLNGEATRPYSVSATATSNATLTPPEDTAREVITDRNATHVLFTQGMRDTLFNFNEAWWNWQCMSQRSNGTVDVGLITHQSGHIIPGLQPAAGEFGCGDLTVDEATLAFFDEKLRNMSASPILQLTKDHVCLSLADQDAVYIRFEDLLAPRATGISASQSGSTYTEKVIEVDGYAIPQTPITVPTGGFTLNGIAAAFSAVIPQDEFLLTVTEEMILAGIPLISVTIDAVSSPLCDPITGCDSQIFVGLGKRSDSQAAFELIDQQVTPLRGTGSFSEVEMVGIAERLLPGDELALLIYGVHEQFFTSASRDPIAQFLNVNGTIQLPLYSAESSVIIDQTGN